MNYRESISRIADIQYTHKKQSGGSGQFAAISVRSDPVLPFQDVVMPLWT